MSGNPFRTSLQQTRAAAASAPTFSFIHNADSKRAEARELDSDSVHASPLPAKTRTKKSVRIESPTSSHADDALLQPIDGGPNIGSPPPVSPAGFSDNFEDIAVDDLVGKDTDRRDDAYEARGSTGSSRKGPTMVEAVNSPSGAPFNPFSRTLATVEPQLAHTAAQNRDRPAADKTGSTTTRASLDVEAFKRLLMTGIPSPPSSGQPWQPTTASNPINASVFESSSSTETSSISRQSIFEPVQEPHVETPRTSYEMAASDDDERAGLMGDAKKTEKKTKPPLPKHRYGKLVTSRTPQTVSFSEFSVPGFAARPTSSPNSHHRTDSDLNKPLPPPPPFVSSPGHISSQDQFPDERPPLNMRNSGSSTQSDAPLTQKKMPPPVPIARRQSQLRTSTTSNRSRSNSSLTMSSQHSTEIPLSPGISIEATSSFSSPKAPPPPPPARRHGSSLTGNNTPSANSSTTELSSTATARLPTVSSANPPSSRRTALSSPPPSPLSGLGRTSSVSSNRNPRSISSESATMPPPPPPPRRRQSGRSSLDKELPHVLPNSSPTESRRTSSENKRSSLDSKRRTSVASESSLRHEYTPASENEQVLYSPKEELVEEASMVEQSKSNSSTILDDMEKFQREIDELRAKYKQTG